MTKKAIVGRKIGMTQIWDEDNKIVPVTVVEVNPCRVVEIKTQAEHGYNALQVAIDEKDPSKMSKAEAGHYKKAGVTPGKNLLELRLEDVSAYEVGQEIGADTFEAGEWIDVSGVSKGKGYAGVMKRHNFAGQRATHGAHLVHRMPGSIGQCATPSRVFKGMKMAGRMGGEKVTTQNLKIVKSEPEKNVVLVKGAVPGKKGGVVILSNATKKASK